MDVKTFLKIACKSHRERAMGEGWHIKTTKMECHHMLMIVFDVMRERMVMKGLLYKINKKRGGGGNDGWGV